MVINNIPMVNDWSSKECGLEKIWSYENIKLVLEATKKKIKDMHKTYHIN